MKTLLLLTFRKPPCFIITQIHSIANRPEFLISERQSIILKKKKIRSYKVKTLQTFKEVSSLDASTPQMSELFHF
jgi:hypothetical protein